MKMAKALALMFALVLAVFCFNAPLILAGDDVPWDEEGTGKLDNNGSSSKPGTGEKDTTSTGSSTNAVADEVGSLSTFIIDVQLVTWYFSTLI